MAPLRNLSRTSPSAIISDMWSKRAFLGLLGYSRVKSSLADTNAAALWWLLEPGLRVAVYGTIFGLILPPSSRPDDFLISLVIGIAVFQTYENASTRGTSLFPESRGLAENTALSPWAFAVSTVVETYLKALALIVIVFIAALALGATPTWWWLAFPLVFVWSGVFLYSISLLTAALSQHFPSFPKLLGAFNRLVFYSSGIFWSIEKVLADSPNLLLIAQLNPVYQLILMSRSLLLGHEIDWATVATLNVLSTVALVAVGTLLFSKTLRRGDA